MSEQSENWFILPYDNPDLALSLLTQDGIPCHSAERTSVKVGVMFPAASVNRVLELLHLDCVYTLNSTGRESIFIMQISERAPAVVSGPAVSESVGSAYEEEEDVASDDPSRWGAFAGELAQGPDGYMGFWTAGPDGIQFERPVKEPSEPDFSKPHLDKHIANLEAWDDLVPVLKGLYRVFGIRANVDNPHGKCVIPSESADDQELFIHFWSTIGSGSGHSTKHKTVLGYTLVGGQVDFIHPSGVGHLLKDGDLAIAEYVNNNLYILFDLPHEGGCNVTEIFAKIVEAFLEFKQKTQEQIREFRNVVLYGTPEGTPEDSRNTFIRSCSKLYEKNLAEMESHLRKYDETIDKYNAEAVKASRDRAILFDKYMPLKTSIEERRAWASNEYDALCASPHVEKVIVNDKVIQIYTDLVTIVHQNDRYDIGKFRIDINTDGAGSVKAFNISNKKLKSDVPVHHPHIVGNGKCCLGNIAEGVMKLLADYQYVVLAQIMIDYLHTYNPDSAYVRIAMWGEPK